MGGEVRGDLGETLLNRFREFWRARWWSVLKPWSQLRHAAHGPARSPHPSLSLDEGLRGGERLPRSSHLHVSKSILLISIPESGQPAKLNRTGRNDFSCGLAPASWPPVFPKESTVDMPGKHTHHLAPIFTKESTVDMLGKHSPHELVRMSLPWAESWQRLGLTGCPD